MASSRSTQQWQAADAAHFLHPFTDFAALATTVQACVAAREVKEGMKPPSEPQLFIGPALKAMLPLYSLTAAPPTRN